MLSPTVSDAGAGARPERPGPRIHSLDGLRAISIAIVVLGHAAYRAGRAEPILEALPTGLGVDVFFVVSGYLITQLLLREQDKTGGVSLRAFYFRRVLRIFPALYAYAGTIALLAAAGYVAVRPSAFVSALTFTWNYPPGDRPWWLGHCWSLSVEEQFYLFWPCLLVWLGRRRALLAAAGMLVAEPIIRVGQYAALPALRGYIDVMGHTRMDTILYGCVLALVEATPNGRQWLLARVRGAAASAAVVLLVIGRVLQQRFHGAWALPFGYSLEGACIAVVLFWSVTNAASPFGRFLGWAPVVWVGRISYSLYLWQQLFLSHPSTWAPPLPFPINVAAALGAAVASFYVIEQPMLRVRDRVLAKKRNAAAAGGGALRSHA